MKVARNGTSHLTSGRETIRVYQAAATGSADVVRRFHDIALPRAAAEQMVVLLQNVKGQLDALCGCDELNRPVGNFVQVPEVVCSSSFQQVHPCIFVGLNIGCKELCASIYTARPQQHKPLLTSGAPSWPNAKPAQIKQAPASG